jgi:hypothetical protein
MGKAKAFRPGVVCEECGEWLTMLTHIHMKVRHGLTQFEYLVQHPEHCDSTIWGDEHGDAARKRYRKLLKEVNKERKARGYDGQTKVCKVQRGT